MDDLDVRSRFARCSSNAARREALEGIVSQLTNHEWRFLRDRLATRSFQFDIVGSLPVELAILVFSHLELSAMYRSRRVSRTWNTLLQSEQLQKAVVGVCMDESVADGATALRKARRYLRLQSACPCHHVSVQMNFHLQSCLLVDDNLIWQSDPEARHLNVLNLSDGQRWQAQGEAREMVGQVAMSDRLLAFVTMNNTCYVMDPSTRERSSFRLPGHMLRRVACRGSMVACAGPLHGKLHIYAWNHDTGSGDFELEVADLPPIQADNFLILPVPDKRAVTIFYLTELQNRSQLTCQTIDSTGKQLSQSELVFSGRREIFLLDYQPVDAKHRFAIVARESAEPERRALRVLFEFDDRLMIFTSIQAPFGSRDWMVGHGSMWWRYVLYQLGSKEGKYHCWDTPVCRGTQECAEDRFISVVPNQVMTKHLRDPDEGCKFFLSDMFAVVFTHGVEKYLEVYCFDDHAQFPTEQLRSLGE